MISDAIEESKSEIKKLLKSPCDLTSNILKERLTLFESMGTFDDETLSDEGIEGEKAEA